VLCVLQIFYTLQLHVSYRAETTSTQDVLASLHAAVAASGVTRANVSHAHIWEGAPRTFLQSTFNTQQPLYFKFRRHRSHWRNDWSGRTTTQVPAAR